MNPNERKKIFSGDGGTKDDTETDRRNSGVRIY